MKYLIENELNRLKTNQLLIEMIEERDHPFVINDSDVHNDIESEFQLFNKKRIHEGLIKTYPLNFALQRLSEYGLVNFNKNIIYLQFNLKHLDIIDSLISIIDLFGYFVSQYKVLPKGKEVSSLNYIDYFKPEELKDKDIEQLWLVIEMKFDSLFEGDVKYLYHLTERKNLDKIKKYGMIPKSKSKKSYHPDRIYVVLNINNLKDLLINFTSTKNNINDYCILKIDYNKAGKPKLYNDPNYLDLGYYIIDNIPYNSIEEIINPNKI